MTGVPRDCAQCQTGTGITVDLDESDKEDHDKDRVIDNRICGGRGKEGF